MSNIPSVFIGQTSRLTTAQLASSNRQAIFLSRIKPLRSCLEFIPAFYKECFRGFLFVLMRSIAGYVTNKNGEKDRKQI